LRSILSRTCLGKQDVLKGSHTALCGKIGADSASSCDLVRHKQLEHGGHPLLEHGGHCRYVTKLIDLFSGTGA
jgi:hypothetical protein